MKSSAETPARDAGGAATEAMVAVRLANAIECWSNDGRLVTEAEAQAMLDAAQPDAGALREEVGRLTRERDESFRRHAITEREACDAASRIGELMQTLELRDVALRESQAALTAAREGQAASERTLAGARAALRQVEKRGRSRGGHTICPSCGGLMDRGEFGFPTPPIGHAPGCALATVLAAAKGDDLALAELRVENDRLRALLATSDAPCPYCALPADRMAECASGIPGCARADDMGADGIDSASAPDFERAAADDPIPDFDPTPLNASGSSAHSGPETAGASTGGEP